MEYTFWWSPEGKPVITIKSSSLAKAKKVFRLKYPEYAKYMGEVSWTTDEDVTDRRLGKLQA